MVVYLWDLVMRCDGPDWPVGPLWVARDLDTAITLNTLGDFRDSLLHGLFQPSTISVLDVEKETRHSLFDPYLQKYKSASSG